MKQKEDLILETFPVGSFQCNCSLIYSQKTKEALIVDPGNDLEAISSLISERGLKVKKLLHTHAHFDHIGQSSEVAKQTGAELYLHSGDSFLYESLEQQGMFFRETVAPPSEEFTKLQDEETFSLESVQLKEFLHTIHTPGHTPGSCCFYTDYFDEPVLLSGDTLFKGSIGRTDLPGGSFEEIIKSIKKRLTGLPGETEIITGHGPSSTIHQEKSQNPFLNS